MTSADSFLLVACLDYERWNFTDAAKAARMLEDDPSLSRTNIWAAAARPRTEPDARERLAAACIAGRREEVDLALLQQLTPHERIELVHCAVEARRVEGVRLLAELGFDISGMTKHLSVGVNLAATPLHNACGDLAMTKLLIELGADPNVRDRTYDSTPLGWAAHGRRWDVVDYLLPLTKVDIDAWIARAEADGDAELVDVLRRHQ